MGSSLIIRPGFFATQLRQELRERARQYAKKHEIPYCESYGDVPVIVFEPYDVGKRHGNFLPSTYRAILADENWARRLSKTHTSGRRHLPRTDRGFWGELDSSNSSDALLMNVFCYPGVFSDGRVYSLLGVEAGSRPEFGVKARVPLADGKFDRTEVDMRLGSLLVEAKLTESDFQTKSAAVLESYRDFHEVFDPRALPRSAGAYLSYQLIRNVLAANATGASFCVLADARRPDLTEATYLVLRAIRSADLRTRCKMLTWQELAEAVPARLQRFLGEKYGISNGDQFDLRPVGEMID